MKIGFDIKHIGFYNSQFFIWYKISKAWSLFIFQNRSLPHTIVTHGCHGLKLLHRYHGLRKVKTTLKMLLLLLMVLLSLSFAVAIYHVLFAVTSWHLLIFWTITFFNLTRHIVICVQQRCLHSIKRCFSLSSFHDIL